jgi:transposase
MPKKIDITIEESIDFLEKSYQKAESVLCKDRIKCLIYVKKGQYCYNSDIAKKLGRTEKTVRGWLSIYNQERYAGLIDIKSGGNNTKVLSDKMLESIQEKLNDEKSTITSYVELKGLLEEELGEKIKYQSLYSHCKRKHKAKLKVSRKSHYKKDANAEAFFKKP